MYMMDFKRQRNQRSNCQHPLDHRKSKGIPGKHLLHWPRQSLYVDHNKLWNILKEMGIQDHLICFLRNPYAVKKQQLEPDMEQWTNSKLGKKYIKAIYCHPAYLTYAEFIMWNAGLDEAQAGIKMAREISITSDMQMTPPLWQKVKRN